MLRKSFHVKKLVLHDQNVPKFNSKCRQIKKFKEQRFTVIHNEDLVTMYVLAQNVQGLLYLDSRSMIKLRSFNGSQVCSKVVFYMFVSFQELCNLWKTHLTPLFYHCCIVFLLSCLSFSSIFDKCPDRLITSITAKQYILQKTLFHSICSKLFKF